MKIGIQMSYIPQKKAKMISKFISYSKSMIYVWKNTKKEDFLIFDLKCDGLDIFIGIFFKISDNKSKIWLYWEFLKVSI